MWCLLRNHNRKQSDFTLVLPPLYSTCSPNHLFLYSVLSRNIKPLLKEYIRRYWGREFYQQGSLLSRYHIVGSHWDSFLPGIVLYATLRKSLTFEIPDFASSGFTGDRLQPLISRWENMKLELLLFYFYNACLSLFCFSRLMTPLSWDCGYSKNIFW